MSQRTTAPAGPSQVIDVRASKRSLVGGCVGNFIEWYEFGVYGYFATIIAANFFTAEGSSDLEALVKTYASFAIAFFFRPVGAWLFGRLGDRFGRRPVLVLVLLVMALGTALIGVLPTRETVGAAAPWLLTLVRIVQGLSAGGEFGGAVSLMTEHAPPRQRGRYGSWQSFTVALGLLAGAGTAAVLATALSEEALHAWGWRIPFLLALPLGLVALWVRLRVQESPVFREVTEAEQLSPPRDARPAAHSTGTAILLGIARLMGWAAAGYTFLVVMPTYLQVSLGASFKESLIAGPGPAMLSEMFHTRVRYTGLGLSYSLSNAVFAGSAGLLITELIKSTANKDIPAYYVIATCVVSAVALATLRRDDHLHSLPR